VQKNKIKNTGYKTTSIRKVFTFWEIILIELVAVQ